MDAPVLQRAATINDLPDEIMLDVFHRLPLKSCTRCRSVSKRWRALVSSPLFGRLYVSPILFFKEGGFWCWYLEATRKGDSETPQRPSFISDSEYDFTWFPLLDIVATCNDLLFGPGLSRRFLWGIFNPFTKQLVELPLDKEFGVSLYVGATGFISKQKKIVVIRFLRTRKRAQHGSLRVYGRKFLSETGRWTNLSASCPPPREVSEDLPLIAHNDKLYWLAVEGVVEYDPFSDLWNLFDLSYATATPLRGILGFCDESLRVAFNSGNDLRIWELKKNSKKLRGEWEWNLVHDLVFKDIAPPPIYGNIDVLSFHLYDPHIIYLRWGHDDILLCNLQHKTLQFLHKLPPFPRPGAFLLRLPWWPTGPSRIPTNDFIVADTDSTEKFIRPNMFGKRKKV